MSNMILKHVDTNLLTIWFIFIKNLIAHQFTQITKITSSFTLSNYSLTKKVVSPSFNNEIRVSNVF